MIPLGIEIWHHHQSATARRLAAHLYRQFNGRHDDLGPRIPVAFVHQEPEQVSPLLQARTARLGVVVVLLDATMAAADRADSWGRMIVELLRQHPYDSFTWSALPVALDRGAFELSEDLEPNSFIRLDHMSGEEGARLLTLQVAVRAIRLLRGDAASDRSDASELPSVNVELFISHAKADLLPIHSVASGPVAVLHSLTADLPVQPWIDAREIPAGGRFADEIHSGILRASAIVSVLTDNYSSREWCRKEILDAKTVGRPVVLVDALASRVARLFPYIGNTPVVRWRASLDDSASSELLAIGNPTARQAWELVDGRLVLEVTLLETLRYLYDRALLGSERSPDDYVIGTQPEALTVMGLPPEVSTVLYPDPPLGREELERLTVHRPALQLTTTLERLVSWPKPEGLGAIALSISESSGAGNFGGSAQHLAAMAHDMSLYLLLGGLRLIYGGSLTHTSLTTEGNVNYLDMLLQLVRRHSPLARQLSGKALAPIENWLAWPMYDELSEDDRKRYTRLVGSLKRVPPPADVDLSKLDSSRSIAQGSAGDGIARRYAQTRSLTLMREESTKASSARILVGGRLDNYLGYIPGLVEEALLTLRSRKPVYVLGEFGGASRAVGAMLQGREVPEMTASWCQENVIGWSQLIAEYKTHGQVVHSPEEVADEISRLGRIGESGGLNNGLTRDENEELFAATDAREAVRLVTQGLKRTYARSS